MKNVTVTLGLLGTMSCFITLLIYYWYHIPIARYYKVAKSHKKEAPVIKYLGVTNIPMKRIPLDEIYQDESKGDLSVFEEVDYQKKAFFINTPGCQIPVAMIDYGKYIRKQQSCGKRAVFLKKIDSENVRFTIKTRTIKKYLRRSANFNCCYRFIKRSSHIGHESREIEYTTCRKILDGQSFHLETEFVNIKCHEYDTHNMTHIIYSDVYGFIKKIKMPLHPNKRDKYNVLMIGMDSMSLSRTTQTMSRTIRYFQDNSWLGFRGYHKACTESNRVADNTFPNLMAAFTGKKQSDITEYCLGKMDKCNDFLIWSTYKKMGYATAYGEDYLRLPDTFSKENAFKNPPTDHYLRTFYLHGEHELYNKSLVCTGKIPSGEHLLDYAFEFAQAYRDDAFFGLFWMNSFSHNINSNPQEADRILENFFNRLSYTGILDSTFIIFFSDHGIRFGKYRVQPAAYYEERMPALFIWTPSKFVERNPSLFKSAAANQFRLITPYDIYNTLINIGDLSKSANYTIGASEACSECHSIFEVAHENRTCENIGIHAKWCACHRLYPLDTRDFEGMRSVIHASNQIKSMVSKIKTIKCWGCLKLALSTVIRIHFYYYNKILYYLVAFTMTPGNMSYEAVVSKENVTRELIGAVSVISVYRGLGKCVIEKKDRLFCVCQKKENC